MSLSPVQQYLDVLFNKALDEAAERIEFWPGSDGGKVLYYERHDLCHETELPADLHQEITQQILTLAHLKFNAGQSNAESWMRFGDEAESCRVHVAAQAGLVGPAVQLSF